MIGRTVQHQAREIFRYKDPGNMATIGRGSAIADFGTFHLTGFVASLAWLFVHVFNLIGFRNQLVVMLQWAWSYASYQRNVRLITSAATTSSAANRIWALGFWALGLLAIGPKAAGRKPDGPSRSPKPI